MTTHHIIARGVVTERDHDGYCSDHGETHETKYTNVTKYIDIPNKQFLRYYCDEHGNIDVSVFPELSKKYESYCSGGCLVTYEYSIESAKLVRKDNIRDECLNDMSSESEPEPATIPKFYCKGLTGIVIQIPNPKYRPAEVVKNVNKIRPFSKSQLERRAEIDCKFGSHCRRYKNGTCHFKH